MRIALISDIHGNLPALRAVLTHPACREAERILCLGDVVGYYPAPNECAALLREAGVETILGNHDVAFLEGKPCRDNPMGRASQRLMERLVDKDTRAFLASLPAQLRLELEGRVLWLLHGSPDNPLNGYVNPEDSVVVPPGVDVLAMGHTHKPFSRRVGSALVVNPGAVGQPRDGLGGACFASLELPAGNAEHYRLTYQGKPELPQE